jgi:hypothetical protein
MGGMMAVPMEPGNPDGIFFSNLIFEQNNELKNKNK